MGDSPLLDCFIKAAKEHGATDEFLVAMLREKGWSAKDIYRHFAQGYVDATGVAIPEPPRRLKSAREAFFHLLAFVTLGTWVFATGWIWFELDAAWFPDSNFYTRNDFSMGQISWQLASIVVAFPAFIWATRSILGDLQENPDKAESSVRRWVTNLGLLFTAIAFANDLIVFFASLLKGELTIRLALNCLAAFILAGAVLLYYSRALAKSTTLPPLTWHRNFAVLAGGIVLLTLGCGFWLNGSPAILRVLNEDNRKIRDLYNLALKINGSLHSSTTLSPQKNLAAFQFYEYRTLGGTRYQLCTHFGSASTNSSDGESAQFWSHPAGLHCFAFDATIAPADPPDLFR